MPAIIALLVLAALTALLVRYARHDRFSAPRSTIQPGDEPGCLGLGRHPIPRG